MVSYTESSAEMSPQNDLHKTLSWFLFKLQMAPSVKLIKHNASVHNKDSLRRLNDYLYTHVNWFECLWDSESFT